MCEQLKGKRVGKQLTLRLTLTLTLTLYLPEDVCEQLKGLQTSNEPFADSLAFQVTER